MRIPRWPESQCHTLGKSIHTHTFSSLWRLWCWKELSFLSRAEGKAYLIRNRLSSLTVIPVACAHGGSGIPCVVRMGSPTCPRAWQDASLLAVLAEIRWHTPSDSSLLCFYPAAYSSRVWFQVFSGCRCVALPNMQPGNLTATPGRCPGRDGCHRIFPGFMVLSVLSSFIISLGGTPGFMVLVRCETISLMEAAVENIFIYKLL